MKNIPNKFKSFISAYKDFLYYYAKYSVQATGQMYCFKKNHFPVKIKWMLWNADMNVHSPEGRVEIITQLCSYAFLYLLSFCIDLTVLLSVIVSPTTF